jgi:large subunit ribosomal protein L4
MPQLEVKDWKNKTVRTVELDPAVFDYPVKDHLIYEAACAYRAGGRSGTHKVKNRSEVSGGTRKMWRQKGTGRARTGDNRSPLWRHGGVVHGPRPRDYSWNFPKRMRRNALRSILSQKLRDGEIVCIESFGIESPKTQQLEAAVRGGLSISRRALLVPLEEERNLSLAARNNPGLKVVRALGVSVVDLLMHDSVVISEEALGRLTEVLAS